MTSSSENKEEKPAPMIFGDESLSDMTLVVGDQDFKVHKMILASRSDVFKAMFYGQFKESKDDRVEIKDVSVDTFRRFLEIIYTGKISDSSKFLEFPHDHHRIYHIVGEPIEIYHDFWKDTTEILNFADRFNLISMVKDYFGTVIPPSLSYCKNNRCQKCFNTFVFAIINGIDVSKCEKKYPSDVYSDWANYAGEKPFPGTLHVKEFNRLRKQLS